MPNATVPWCNFQSHAALIVLGADACPNCKRSLSLPNLRKCRHSVYWPKGAQWNTACTICLSSLTDRIVIPEPKPIFLRDDETDCEDAESDGDTASETEDYPEDE